MAERRSDRWISIALSVVLHGALVGALAYGFWAYHAARPKPTLAIEAAVVDARTVKGELRQAPEPAPAPPPPPASTPPPEPVPEEPTGPPEPTPEELAQRQQAQKDEELKQQALQEAAEQRKLEEQKQEQERQAEAAKAQATKAEAARQAQARADAERKAKKRAEEQRLAEQKRQEEAQREADAQDKAQVEADLKRSLAAEEHSNSARSSVALASWQSQIAARIQHAWLRPPTARSGIECVLYVTQVPGGEVVNVRIGSCNGDQAVRESIEAAAYRASPLPPPPDPSLFERNLEITFKPD
jgi:colicin import membrane protein